LQFVDVVSILCPCQCLFMHTCNQAVKQSHIHLILCTVIGLKHTDIYNQMVTNQFQRYNLQTVLTELADGN
jgi:hypothetical protein